MKKIALNFGWLLVERGGQVVSALIVSGLIARSLGVGGYGEFQYALAVVLFFSSFGLVCGAEVILPRMVDSSRLKARRVIFNAFLLRELAAGCSYGVLLIFSFFSMGSGREFWTVAVVGLMVFFREPSAVVTTYLQSQSAARVASLLGLCATLGRLLFVVCVYSLGVNNPIYYAFAWVLEACLISLGLLYVFRRRFGRAKDAFCREEIYSLFAQGWPFLVGLIAMYGFLRVDRFLVRFLSSAHELGIYSASMQITDNVNQLAPLMAVSAAPVLIYGSRNESLVKKHVLFLALGMGGLALIGCLSLFSASEWIMGAVFGGEFVYGAKTLSASLLLCPLVFFEAGLNTYLIKYGLGQKTILKWGAAAVICVVVGYFTIPSYGGIGAVMAVASGYVFAIGAGVRWIFR
ncbi:oligosaccharide flippase family protein [Jeongeupia sp. HS-3]|uniref:oligosaccharide flippase family protein n=1 Tax=Jeongeupia sp. HS-3 TaxID=1009682 RepID=UPI001910A532|nr:oligosaccharide flippase family protein [Jeongeupia sp. HS-3]